MKKSLEWKQEADNLCNKNFGLSLDDLPDCCYMDWYEEGITPARAVLRAMKNAQGE
jgi:hypothetical protein